MITILANENDLLKRLKGAPADGYKDKNYEDLRIGDRVKLFYNIFDSQFKDRDFIYGIIEYDINKNIPYISIQNEVGFNPIFFNCRNKINKIVFHLDYRKLSEDEKALVQGSIDSREIAIDKRWSYDDLYSKFKQLLKYDKLKFHQEIVNLYLKNKIELRDDEIKQTAIDLDDENLEIEFKFSKNKRLLEVLNISNMITIINKAILSSRSLSCAISGQISGGSTVEMTSHKVLLLTDIYWNYEILDDKKSKLIISDTKKYI